MRVPEENPIELNQDMAPEDVLLEQSNLDAFPDSESESWQLCTFNSNFLELDSLKFIVLSHGSVLLQFDMEGLWVSPMKLKVHPATNFRMQPSHFVRESGSKSRRIGLYMRGFEFWTLRVTFAYPWSLFIKGW